MDIWTKAGTFSSSALARLGNKLLATSTSTESKTAQRSPVAPMMSPTGPSASPGEQFLLLSSISSNFPFNNPDNHQVIVHRPSNIMDIRPLFEGALYSFLDLDPVVAISCHGRTKKNRNGITVSSQISPRFRREFYMLNLFSFLSSPSSRSLSSSDSIDFILSSTSRCSNSGKRSSPFTSYRSS